MQLLHVDSLHSSHFFHVHIGGVLAVLLQPLVHVLGNDSKATLKRVSRIICRLKIFDI